MQLTSTTTASLKQFIPTAKQQAGSWSVFGQGTYHVSDTSDTGQPALFPFGEARRFSRNRSSVRSVSPDLAARATSPRQHVPRHLADLTPAVMIGTWPRLEVRGFVSSTYGYGATFAFKPEQSRTSSGGQGTLLGRTLVLNGLIYRKQVKVQVSTYNPNV